MTQTATLELINSLIDSNMAALKAQIAALKFNPDPVTTTSTTTTTTTLPPTTTTTTTTVKPTTSTTTTTSTPKPTTSTTTTTTTPTSSEVNPGGVTSMPLSFSGVSNKIISGLSFDGGGKSVDLITLNNCSNVHITLCRFSNTNGYSISLNNCTNITVDFNFFTMVNFGVHAEGCVSTKVNNNQGLNLWGPVLYKNNFAHWVQFHNCSGVGQQVNNNKFENVLGVAIHPHDHISIDTCNGTSTSPFQINNNWLRGGQSTGGWPGSGDTGGGIMAPDEAGNYIEVRNNIMDEPGCAGIQAIGTGTNILLDGNIIFNGIKNAVFMNVITVSGTHSAMTISNNRAWVINKNGVSTIVADGEPYLYMNHATTVPGVTVKGNTWGDKTLNSSILPIKMITYK
jgi:hypothetical protein